MFDSPLALGGFAVLLVEVVVLFAAPMVLCRLAFWRVPAERRIRLPMPRRQATDEPGYREPAEARPAVALPVLRFGRIELDDAMLVQDTHGPSFALRRKYQFGRRRAYYLVRIDMALEGNEVVLTARQAFVPITLPIAAIAIGMGIGEDDGEDRWTRALLFLGVAASVFVVQQLFLAGARDEALHQAYDVIEDEVRREHPEPKKKRKKKAPEGDAAPT